MAAEQVSRLVLLDPRNEHRRFEEDYAAPLFVRVTDRGRCLLHVLSNRAYVRLFHLFLPDSEDTLIRTQVFLFRNTIFYIYCVHEAIVRLMERTHNYPMFVKAFHVDDLSMYLHQAAIGHLLEGVAHGENDRDAALQEAAHHARQLAEELENHMVTQTGRPPEERR